MPITERTLKRWRKEALETKTIIDSVSHRPLDESGKERILRMTQELLDAHLIRKE